MCTKDMSYVEVCFNILMHYFLNEEATGEVGLISLAWECDGSTYYYNQECELSTQYQAIPIYMILLWRMCKIFRMIALKLVI
jgi:hypothetical protein